MPVVEKLVFFGKGGIGKSTISSNLSAVLASQDRKILHIGCDPKHDSTLSLTGDISMPTFQERNIASHYTQLKEDEFLVKGKFGIDCIEAGGPEPGVGCAGYGITQMLDTLTRLKLVHSDRYDTVVFDILGDIVCGGFAAPLRLGFAGKIFIVVSEEMAALYAANNIAKAARNYAANGAVLGGLIVNMRDPEVDREMLERFAGILNTKILGFIPRDPAVRQAEYLRKTLIEHVPESDIVKMLKDLAAKALALDPAKTQLPTPIDDRLFTELSLRQFRHPPARKSPQERSPGVAAPPAAPKGAPVQRQGGPRSIELFSKLLKLEDSWRLVSASLEPDGVIGFGVKDSKKGAGVVLLKPHDDRGAFIKTPHFAVCFQDAGSATPAFEKVLQTTAARLGSVPLRTLQRVLERDPGAVGMVFAPPTAGRIGLASNGALPEEMPAGGFWNLPTAPPDLSLQFFFDETSAVGGFPQGSLFVHHTDRECMFVFLSGPFGMWERKINEGTSREGNDGPRVVQLTADSGMEDILQGGGVAKLEAAIDDFLRHNPKPDLLVVRTYCVPMVIGDDVSGVLERLSRKYKFAVTNTTSLNPESEVLRNAIKPALGSRRFLKAVPDPAKVNLLGFSSGRPRAELAELLGAMGLEVGQNMFPGWNYTGIQKLREAGLQVLSPRKDYAEVFAEIKKGKGLKFLSPGSPYGLIETRNWLKAIEAATDRKGNFEKAHGKRYRELHRTWKTLRAQASRHRLGLVIPEADLPALSDGRALGGLPILPMLREMGFGIELLLWSPPTGRRAVLGPLGESAAPAGPPPARGAAAKGVKRFSTPAELERLLSKGDFSAAYSDVCHDRRLLRNGKGRFSRSCFEPGFDGALRTLRRLLRICELPFHRRYQHHWRNDGRK